ncbi:ARM repeat superfamily protein [Euphorbia peplus]|nr:ARM repeat superfamily protein [Euphorbia peplus]
MALRPIDNALPLTPERPKMQVKVSNPMQKQLEFGVNDENIVPVATDAAVVIDYISSENLKPIPDPELKIQGLVDGLDSKDWVKVCDSLNNARRFALHHSSLLLPILEKVVVVVVKAMKNPRSALCKTSIMASTDIFKVFGDKLLNFTTDVFDNMLLQLLLKSSQDKRFVCDEADLALKAMVKSISPLPLLQKLQLYVSHANLRIRAKVAICISNCASNMGLEGMKEFGLELLLQMAANLLKDRLPEAREAARKLVTAIFEAYTEHEEQELKQESWQSFCQSNLSALDALSVAKITSSQ